MGHRRVTQVLLIGAVIKAFMPQSALAQEDQFYPHGALTNTYYEEQTARTRAEQLEREAIRKHDDYEAEKRETERQIAAHKFQIEELKNRQTKAQEELDVVNANLTHVKEQIGNYETEHKKLDEQTSLVLKDLETQRAELDTQQKSLQNAILTLSNSRKKAEREIYTESLEIQRLKSDTAKMETKIATAEAKRTELEAEEMKARTEWMQMKMQSAELIKERDQAVSQLDDAKTRWNQAQKELSDAKADLARVQKNHDQVLAQVKTDVARYEKEIMAANRAKIASEAEQIRLAAESEKMKDYAARIRETRDEAIDQEDVASGMVLRTKVAVETARTELTKNVEAADRTPLLQEKERNKQRGLASAAEASRLLDGGRIWKTSDKCRAFAKPDSNSKPVGFFEPGRKLLGRDRSNGWVEISNGVSKVYVESQCGEYQN